MGCKNVFGSILVGVVFYLPSGLGQKDGPTPESVHLIESIQGPALYKAYCAVCHGGNGKGSGPMAQTLKVRPADLTRISARNGGNFPLAGIRKVIAGQEQVPAGHGTREMPLWGPIFSQIAWDVDLGSVRVDNLARYLEEMQTR
jgi:mono/diheme cytochrome c family protein